MRSLPDDLSLKPATWIAEDFGMSGLDFETASRGSDAPARSRAGRWALYGPRVLVSVAAVAVLAGGAVYASRVSESAPKVVYTASLKEVAAESEGSLKVDINSADVGELDELPEVGPATAEAIVEYRRANGSFTAGGGTAGVTRVGPPTGPKIQHVVPPPGGGPPGASPRGPAPPGGA